jgi:hypothetical protein
MYVITLMTISVAIIIIGFNVCASILDIFFK